MNMKELLRSVVGLARIMTPIMCRLVGIVGILQGVGVLAFAVFLALRSQQPPTLSGLVMLAAFGIVSIAMGIVIFKWFTRFMMWNLQRCAKAWGLEQADK
jgi:uncharacterized ion transporter superfamily protein YfcC